MPVLTDAQIAGYAAAAGFTGSDLSIAVAVCLAESRGNSDATHVNSDAAHSTDYGLWQINSYWNPDIFRSGNWSNPADNARMAYAIYKRQGWRAWSTYNHGEYLTYLARGTTAASNPDTSAGSTTQTLSTDNPLSPIGDAVNFLSSADTWKALLFFVLGAGLCLYGISNATGIQNQVTNVVKTAAKAAVLA